MFDWLRNRFPYTNFHDLNADWIITTFREYVERIETALGGIGGYDSRLDAVDADNTRQDSEISGLDSRLTAAEATNSTQATQISGLDTRVSATEATNATQATQISGLDTRVAATEATNATQATQISGIDTRLTTAEATNATQATQISGLDTRVAATEATNATQATQISGLDTRVTALDTRVTALEYKNVVYTIPRDYAPGMESPSITCNQEFAQIARSFPKINVRIDSTAPMVPGGCYQVCNLQPTLFQVDNNTYTAIVFDFYGTRSDGTRGLMRLVHQANDTIVVTNIT